MDHQEFGPLAVPMMPLRVHGTDKHPKIGQRNDDLYRLWLGICTAEIAELIFGDGEVRSPSLHGRKFVDGPVIFCCYLT